MLLVFTAFEGGIGGIDFFRGSLAIALVLGGFVVEEEEDGGVVLVVLVLLLFVVVGGTI